LSKIIIPLYFPQGGCGLGVVMGAIFLEPPFSKFLDPALMDNLLLSMPGCNHMFCPVNGKVSTCVLTLT